MSNELTARFKVDGYFVLEHTRIDFGGGYTNRRIVAPKKDVDFPIQNYKEYTDHYDIIVKDTTIGVCDGGMKEVIIAVPKSMITIANKHVQTNT